MNASSPSLPLRLLAVLFSGAVQAFISPPLNLWWLHFFSWIPFLWALSGVESGKNRLVLGWAAGVAANATIFYWIIHTVINFSGLPRPLAAVVLLLFSLIWGAYAGVFAWGLPRVMASFPKAWPLTVAAWFTACEFLNPQLFPYYQGVAHYQNPSYFLIVSLTGVAGVTFLVLLTNGLLWAAWQTLKQRTGPLTRPNLLRLTALTLLLWAGAFTWSHFRSQTVLALEKTAPTVRIGIVQLNLDIETRMIRMKTDRAGILTDYLDATRQAAALGAQAVVWPEGASPYSLESKKGGSILELARELNVEIWTGGMGRRQDPLTGARQDLNSAYRIDGKGVVDAPYDKMFLLPFGEFMPGRDLIPSLTDAVPGVGNFYAGTDFRVYDTALGPFNFLICYEAIRRELVRGFVNKGTRLLVTITNDAWFGDTSCPTEHLMLTAIRCAEFGIPMVRAANTGISAVIDARGLFRYRTPVFTPEVVVEDVALVHAPSVYGQVGDGFAWLCTAFSLLALMKRRNP